MNPIRRIRRAGTLAGLAGLTCACLGLAVAAPAAFARTLPPFGVSGAVTTPARRRSRSTPWSWAGCPAGRSL